MANKLTKDLVALIFSTGQSLREKIRLSKGAGGSFLQVQTLQFVRSKTKITMRDVADYLHITPPSATSLVDSLVKDSYIKRVSDAADRRVVRLNITHKGVKYLNDCFKHLSDSMELMLEVLTDEEKVKFIQILNKFNSNI